MIQINKIKELSDYYFNDIVKIRRHIHQNPELSFKEFKTSEFIASQLEKENINFKTGFVKTGIIAEIKGKNPTKKTIALRADIDALPIIEENNISYKSQNKAMHACGHDAHTASLIGVAKILNSIKSEFEGTVKLIFQPGEELLPGGAIQMIEQGALNNPKPDIVIAQHVSPELQVGTVGFRKGKYMASSDEIYLTVKGKGGHAAMPKITTNIILIASKIIVALHQMIEKETPQTAPTVLSFGKSIAKGATNVIPNEVKFEGTFRTMDETWRKKAHIKIKNIANSIAKENGAQCDINIIKGYPMLNNDVKVTEKAIVFAQQYLGKEKVIELEQRMTSEDFAYYAQNFPSTFYRLGISNKEKNISSKQHTSTFKIDEDSLKTGMGLMAWLAISLLR
ncbi:MAG: amidohydrolase [Bacteroidetes bacterium]|nr:MAG: amidohydrolase [Bacteroidota bacterium]